MNNQNLTCQIHGVEMVYKKGVSKAGKDYEGYFCPEKKEDGMNCDSVEWINRLPKKTQNLRQKSQNMAQNGSEGYANIITRLSKLEFLIKAFAVRKGVTLTELEDEFQRLQEK